MAGAADAGDMVLAGLVLGGVAQGAGVYNATTDPTFFTGTGEIVVIPEPASVALLAVGGALVLSGRRRRAR